VTCLEEHHSLRLRDPLVLHDAAPAGIARVLPERRRQALTELLKIPVDDLACWDAVCGYFGQVYAGRGIEIIEAMAAARPSCLFLVFGGGESDVATRRIKAPSNLRYMGHVPHSVSQNAQAAVDVLLMPYQQSVSIGIQGHDTARWMSPMKMFEYLAAGVPIISSDLPVLREVLRDGENCLLVCPSDIKSWLDALDAIVSKPKLSERIAANAHAQYQRKHTWLHRGEKILEAYGRL
jgi:glycosyltransferase involved in cell wall biosynthesis